MRDRDTDAAIGRAMLTAFLILVTILLVNAGFSECTPDPQPTGTYGYDCRDQIHCNVEAR